MLTPSHGGAEWETTTISCKNVIAGLKCETAPRRLCLIPHRCNSAVVLLPHILLCLQMNRKLDSNTENNKNKHGQQLPRCCLIHLPQDTFVKTSREASHYHGISQTGFQALPQPGQLTQCTHASVACELSSSPHRNAPPHPCTRASSRPASAPCCPQRAPSQRSTLSVYTQRCLI